MDKKKDFVGVESYFVENADSWIADAYEEVGHNYPVGIHRVRIVRQLLPTLENVGKILDVGSGGGHLSCALAEQGCTVVGLDQSEAMIAHAEKRRASLAPEARERVSYRHGFLGDPATPSGFDAVTAMGVIGYLPFDSVFFEEGARLLRPGGYAIVSFRNRLFNLFSVSDRTINEARGAEFSELAREYMELCQPLDRGAVKAFVRTLHEVTGRILADGSLDKPITPAASPSAAKGQTYKSTIEVRQTTPRQARSVAEASGYDTISFFGVHPHLTVPALNERLPFQVFNRLSDALVPLESAPAALLWSSVFIGVFRLR